MTMACNEAAVAAEQVAQGISRQRLFSGNGVVVDRLKIAAGATLKLEAKGKSLFWLQVLEGDGTLKTPYATERLTSAPDGRQALYNTHSTCLPADFPGALSTVKGVTLLCVEATEAGAPDANGPHFSNIDWTLEDVLQAERDGRKRVTVFNADLCGTGALKADVVIYPPRTSSAEVHHEGAAAFVYVMSGQGSASAGGKTYPLRPGELLCFPDRERHALAAGDNELRFLEFYAPSEFKTVWSDPSQRSGWRKTGRNISGGLTANDEKERWAYRRGAWGRL